MADELTKAAHDVLAERARQIAVEDYDASHDDMATRCQLGVAAMAYTQAATCVQRDIASSLPAPRYWPWDEKYWKPRDPRRNLVMAGALILAEIERLDRIDQQGKAKADG